jgi:hypothetical protein
MYVNVPPEHLIRATGLMALFSIPASDTSASSSDSTCNSNDPSTSTLRIPGFDHSTFSKNR